MTRCVLFIRDGQVTGFVCAGHAGYAEAGEDIVCAAVSALTESCLNAIEAVAGVRPVVRMGQGFLAATLPRGTDSRDANTLLNGLQVGLRGIAAQYPQHFRLKAVSDGR